MRSLVCSLILATSAVALAADEIPVITVSKSDKLAISLAGLDPAIARTVENDLALSGAFTVIAGDKAAYRASGSGARATVTDSGGQALLSRSYSGSPREQAHALADDIIETITGSKGFAGTKIAFCVQKSGGKEIFTCDADGQNLVQLTHDNSISVAPALSPDGRTLAYTGYKSGYADIYTIALGSGARQRIVKFPGTNSGAAFSPDGGRLAATFSKDGNPELYVTSTSGGGARRLTRTAGVESSPTWSPDGSELIYSSDEGGSPQLYRISASGGGGTRIGTGQGYATEPNWSPDGKKVAFNTRGGGSFLVAVHNLSGGGTRTLGEGQDPVWGANSRHLLVASGSSLILLDTQSGARKTLVSGLGKISEPAWSR